MHVVSIFTLVLQSTNTCHSVCVCYSESNIFFEEKAKNNNNNNKK